MKIPYGVSDFYSLRTEGQLYVDRTEHVRTLEELGKALLFLRPRRFGKSLWLSVLPITTICERPRSTRFSSAVWRWATVPPGGDEGGEYRGPTALAHRYFILEWDFSDIDPNPPFGEGPRPRRRRSRRLGKSRGHAASLPEVSELDVLRVGPGQGRRRAE